LLYVHQEAEKRHNDTVESSEQEKAELQRQLEEVVEEEQRLQAKIEALQANNDFTKEQLNNMKAKMEALRENNGDTPRICEQENRGPCKSCDIVISLSYIFYQLRICNIFYPNYASE
jgi:septal ring factor EnvC (AmiA/AmiB activator)